MFRKLLTFVNNFYLLDTSASRRVMTLVLVAGVLEGLGIMLFLPFFQSIATISFEGSEGNPSSGWAYVPEWMSPTQVLLCTCVVFLVVASVRALVMGVRDAQVFALVLRFVDDLRLRLFRAIAESPWHQQAEIDQSEIESAMISGTDRVRAAAALSSLGLVDIVLVAAQTAVLLYISPTLAAISVGLILLAMIVIYPQIRRSFDLGKQLTTLEQDLHLFGTEFLVDLKSAKSQNLEGRHVQRFAGTLGGRAKTLNTFRYRQVLAQGLMQMVVAIVAVVILLIGILLLAVEPATTLLTVIILGRLTAPVFRLYSNYQVIMHTLPAYDTLNDLITRFSVPFPSIQPGEDLPIDSWHGPLLQLENVDFERTGGEVSLKAISFSINPGEAVALFGPSGSGKTTVLDLMLGLQAPSSGHIRYCGQNATDQTASAFRDLCAYVPQDAFLMSTTIRENLKWVASDADEPALRAALDGAGASGLSLDQEVGTRGDRLSGGERQRVRLAQALLRHPRLLVLDEALNAIGQDAVAPMMETIRAFDDKMALVYVTHRMADLDFVDRVFRLSDGQLVAVPFDRVADNSYGRTGVAVPHTPARTTGFET